MSSSLLDRIRRSTAFRLTASYAFVFIASSLVLFLVAYALLAQVIRAQDRKFLAEKMNEYAFIDRTKGTAELVGYIRRDAQDPEDVDTYVRILDPNWAQLITVAPSGWESPPGEVMDDNARDGRTWWTWESPAGGFYEFSSRRLGSGAVLIVGGDARPREILLDQFRGVFFFITATVVFLGVAAGALLARRVLSPVRDLIATVSSIGAGSMDARVPTRGTDDELDELASLFNSMLERISMLIQGMRDALDNVAHDLRTPLTRAKAVVETAMQSNLSREGLREALLDIAEENERIRATLNTLMDISEAETGTMHLNIERLDVAGLMRECMEVYEYLAQEKGIGLEMGRTEGLYAMADEGRVRQVLSNLMDNALKYSGPGGRVCLSGRTLDGRVEVTVRDEGVGIPPGDMPRIFERLYRGDKSRTQRGLGLGLSLVRAVLRAHGGDIRVESREGRGSEFTFTLPGAA